MNKVTNVVKQLKDRSKLKTIRGEAIKQPSWLDLLTEYPEIAKDAEHRIKMTVSCRDCDYIPKVKGAGAFKVVGGKEYQIMHNGVLAEAGGYFGDWMSEIITKLQGHHEPQEEKLFYEILKLLPPGSTMIELGSFWAYYSIWFNKTIPRATNYCCEPDPENLKLGERNAKVNKTKNMNFIQSAAGKSDGLIINFELEGENRKPISVSTKSIDGIMKQYNPRRFDIVHMDVQGAELSALEGAEVSIRSGKVRFVLISTHHYLISGDVLMHEKCLALIKKWGGHVITEHAIHESYSGDGLILASFFKEDRDLELTVSNNRMQDSLFRSYIKDMDILIGAYETSRLK